MGPGLAPLSGTRGELKGAGEQDWLLGELAQDLGLVRAGGGAEAPGEPGVPEGRGGWAEGSLLLPAGPELSWEPTWE